MQPIDMVETNRDGIVVEFFKQQYLPHDQNLIYKQDLYNIYHGSGGNQ
jgi:hypothetical protein